MTSHANDDAGTPRTDAVVRKLLSLLGVEQIVDADFARLLELELQAANSHNGVLQEVARQANERIERLEEALRTTPEENLRAWEAARRALEQQEAEK